MKIVIIGGTGLIGSKLVNMLKKLGHEAIPASPSLGVNTMTGEGVARVLQGTQVVVDVSNSPSFEDKAVLEFFETSGHHLLTAEKAAGIQHHIALSVVGTNRHVKNGYFRAKLAQENLIKASGIPYTIVQSTQFFEFLGAIAQSSTKELDVYLPPAFMQPIASDDVVKALVEVVLEPPINNTIEIAGPERVRLSELIETYLKAIKDPRKVIPDVHAHYYGTEVTDEMLIPGDHPRLGTINFEEWFKHNINH